VLPRALPHPNVLGGHPEHPREREAGISPVPHQCPWRLCRSCGRRWSCPLADRSFTRPYKISYRSVKLPRVSATFGPCYLRCGADLPQVGHPNPMGF
jgi:hypothetical protein